MPKTEFNEYKVNILFYFKYLCYYIKIFSLYISRCCITLLI